LEDYRHLTRYPRTSSEIKDRTGEERRGEERRGEERDRL
jgi:hypothetical protein